MGREARPALPAILTLLRKELETPHPPGSLAVHDRIMDMAAGAIGEVTSDGECPPGSVELLCEILQRRGGAIRGSAAARRDSPGPSVKALQLEEELPAKAVWCLGILGRSAAPAVPLLLSTFESARKVSNLTGATAESLAEISRGTPDEERVLACLAKAWETSPQGAEARDRPGAPEAQPEVGTARRGAQSNGLTMGRARRYDATDFPDPDGDSPCLNSTHPGLPLRTISRSWGHNG